MHESIFYFRFLATEAKDKQVGESPCLDLDFSVCSSATESARIIHINQRGKVSEATFEKVFTLLKCCNQKFYPMN